MHIVYTHFVFSKHTDYKSLHLKMYVRIIICVEGAIGFGDIDENSLRLGTPSPTKSRNVQHYATVFKMSTIPALS